MDKHIEEIDRQEFETWFISLFHPHHMNRNESGSYYFIDAMLHGRLGKNAARHC